MTSLKAKRSASAYVLKIGTRISSRVQRETVGSRDGPLVNKPHLLAGGQEEQCVSPSP